MSNFIKLYKKGPGGLEPLAVAGEQLLSNAVDSASEDVGASSLAVKTAYDKGAEGLAQANAANATAVTAQNTADGKVSKSLADATGVLPVANGGTGTASASGVQRLVGIPGITQRVTTLEGKYGGDGLLLAKHIPIATTSTLGGVMVDGKSIKITSGVISTGGDNISTGFVLPFAANSAPDGYILCNGAAVSRTTYATLFAAIGTLYGAGNGSTTFNLPNLTDRVIQGSATSGAYRAAGLPNITGSFGSVPYDGGSANNAFAIESSGTLYMSWDGVGPANNKNINFAANRSSNIYGASVTVQPPAITMRYYIKY